MASTIKSYHKEMGSDTITYLKKPTLLEYHCSYSPHGLQFGANWLWGQCLDEDGNNYYWCRETLKDYAGFLLYFKSEPGNTGADVQVFQDILFKGYILHILDEENGKSIIRPQYEDGNWFNIEMTIDKITMVDANGKVNFTYHPLSAPDQEPAPGHEWYCPGQYGTMDDTMYRSKHYTVTGEIDGKKIVKGWGGLDTEWGPVGCPTRQFKRFDSIEKLWFCWYTEYDDGTVEDGVFVRGYDKHAAAYYYRNGKAYVPKDLHAEVTTDETGLLKTAVLYVDDMVFDYSTKRLVAQDVCAVDDGQSKDSGSEDMAWTSGLIVNRAMKAKAIAGWANPEFKANNVMEDPIEDMRKPITFESATKHLK